METSKDNISLAMSWYNNLKTEDLVKVHSHIDEMDSMTIVKYWIKNIKG